MFDGALQKARHVFCFGDISVPVRLVDADPGAVQVETQLCFVLLVSYMRQMLVIVVWT